MLTPFPENAARGNVCASGNKYCVIKLSLIVINAAHLKGPSQQHLKRLFRESTAILFYLEHVEMKGITETINDTHILNNTPQ